MIPDAIMIHTKHDPATKRTGLNQPAIPDLPTSRLQGMLKQDSRKASRKLAGIVDAPEWSFETCIGHQIAKGDRLEVEWAVAAERGWEFRVLDVLRAKENESEDVIFLERQALKAAA